ncbi:diguanylate cyclase [Colwellia sp. M166]|uniref:tetratricopeptide repeat-containing diguanylate cyclase n=1 Tax=Colwellia sp. M166 TaxID=2583805 RepID=UPI00211F34AA|nr:diguanylate cyclase [Colwellia sp. M166]|tara:strand:- start:21470 stop:23329 length:1860 start_codon:yes stop_codon:yes gene_type:complete
MTKALQACYVTLIILLLSFPLTTLADKHVNFIDMDHEIYLEPWLSYQKLIGLQLEAKSYDELHYLWWLLRKAQAENLIYFYDDFSRSVKQANNLVTTSTPLAIQARLSLFQGLIERRQGDYNRSQESLAKALIQAKEAQLSSLYVYGKQELAYTKTLTELFETSLIDIQEAYVEAFALKDQFLIASINETYGAIYGYLQDYKKSIEYYQRALEAYQNLQYPAHIAEAIYGLASTYRYWGKYQLAIEYFEKYQQQIAYTPNSNISFFSAYGIGMTLAEQGDCLAAINVIDKALTLKGIVDYNAELYKRKASCLITLGRFEEAEKALDSAALIFADIPELIGTNWQLEVLKISAELTHARGEYDIGYSMLEQYYRQYTELLLKNSSKRLLKVRASLEVERQKIAQALTAEHLQVESLELEKQQSNTTQDIYFTVFITCGSLIVLIVIIAQYRSNRKMHLLTIKDPLSGLFNRRYIFDYLDKAALADASEKIQMSIILIDIDDFKKINDKYGHPVGDDVICQVAEIGSEIFRQDDIFGRIGGEEFMCILPRTDVTTAKKIAERFLSAINQSTVVKGHQDNVTVSIGIATLSAQCRDINQLYINADQALYQAKHFGKNQIKIF